jgi:hypothetical protein
MSDCIWQDERRGVIKRFSIVFAPQETRFLALVQDMSHPTKMPTTVCR